jgi:yecA family protein
LSLPDKLDFDEFCELLMPLGTLNSPSELHGYFCGKLCGGAELSDDECLRSAWDLLDITEQPNPDIEEYVLALFKYSVEQLESGEYNLQPFLPDEDADLEQRTQALSQWCHGFLTGFGAAGIDPNKEFSSDQADALRDLAAIVQVTVDEEVEDQTSDQQESDFFQIVEYVRVIAMNFYEDNLQAKKPPQKSLSSDSDVKTVH